MTGGPGEGADSNTWRHRWSGRLAGVALASALASAALTTISFTTTPTMAGAVSTCGVARLHYLVVTTTSSAPTPTQMSMISGVVVSGLAPGCDGEVAKLVLRGTPGSPTPATALSTATSGKRPCTSTQSATPAVTIKTGSITFDLCPTQGKQASYVSVRDLTAVTLTVGGTTVTVNGGSTASNSGVGGSGINGPTTANQTVRTVTASTSSLAFTGAEIAAMVAAGLLFILAGLLFLLVSRRRRSRPSDGSAAS